MDENGEAVVRGYFFVYFAHKRNIPVHCCVLLNFSVMPVTRWSETRLCLKEQPMNSTLTL